MENTSIKYKFSGCHELGLTYPPLFSDLNATFLEFGDKIEGSTCQNVNYKVLLYF